jgi:hypothetical protein
MKNFRTLKEFQNLKKDPTLNEIVTRMDQDYSVGLRVQIPVSLVNAYIKKVKDESGKNIREFYSDMELAEMMSQHLATTYLDIKNFPVSLTLGEDYSSDASVVEPQTQLQMQPQAQVQTPQAQGQGQPQAQGQPVQGQPGQGQPGQGQPVQGQSGQAQATAAQVPASQGEI